MDTCLCREYARTPRGGKVITKVGERKVKRTNIVAGICLREWVAPLEYTGITDRTLFEHWFQRCLLKEAHEGSVIVLGHATSHRKSILPGLASEARCEMCFSPPDSPDRNPIEKRRAWLKRKLRETRPSHASFDDVPRTLFQVGRLGYARQPAH